jgi:predicted ATPase/DNA-binding XRE family transcriptional regulator
MQQPEGDELPFAALLRHHRLNAGLTQQELAERSGISAQAVSALERGWRQSPRRDTVAMLADALDLDGPARAVFAAAGRRSQPVPRPPGRLGTQQEMPVPSSELVGREDELAAARALLLNPGLRVLTLSGPPGVGKTRLAAALVEALRGDFPDGVVFVSLAPVADPNLVGLTIARALNVRDDGVRPVLDQLVARIAERRALLVLDNFEHLLEAAPLLGELLARCARLRVVVTSRSALRLRDEQELPVAPLPLPDSVTLFVRRARARSPRFELSDDNRGAVTEICRRLDGLPLALELAAAWVKLLDPAALLARLGDPMRMLVGGGRDLPERQRTMRQTLEWSYELLEADERLLFQKLSVFAGGATLDAIEEVWRAGCPDEGALHLVASLVDKNLVVREESGSESRITMLETVREYAGELLAASGAIDETTRAHAQTYARVVETAERRLMGADQVAWLRRLEAEHANLHAAMQWARNADEPELGMLMASRLLRYWEFGRLREGAAWLDGWLGSNPDVSAAVQAQGLYARSVLAFRTGDYAIATGCGEASLELHRALGDRHGTARVLNYLAGTAWEQGLVERAVELCEESLALRTALGDETAVAASLSNLALLHVERGDNRQAEELTRQAVAIYRRTGERRGLGVSLGALVNLALRDGRLDEAEALLEECLALLSETGRDVVMRSQVLNLSAHLARSRGEPGRAKATYREALRMRLRVGNASRVAYDVEGLAAVAWLEGRPDRAARLYGAAAAARAAAGGRSERSEREEHDGIVARIRETLGEERFDAAWSAGHRLSLGETAAEALSD